MNNEKQTSRGAKSLEFTGERLVPGAPNLQNMISEELGRLNYGRGFFQNAVALDFGCGAGYAADFMLKSGAQSVTGIDISMEAVSFAAKHYGRAGLNYARMDCLNTAFKSQVFDFICSLDVIEHFDETDRFLYEIHRLLKRGGRCLISTPNKLHTSPHGKPTWPYHRKEFFLEDLQRELERFFAQVEILGARVPVYDDRAIRKLTNSRLSIVKHYLPARLRVGFASWLRYLMKTNLTIEDVQVTTWGVQDARSFVAVCGNP
jgi:O-antigen biosynthesis protein